jgi:hypothetical protein
MVHLSPQLVKLSSVPAPCHVVDAAPCRQADLVGPVQNSSQVCILSPVKVKYVQQGADVLEREQSASLLHMLLCTSIPAQRLIKYLGMERETEILGSSILRFS